MPKSSTWEKVEPADWRSTIEELRDRGFIFFDFLTGVDQENVDGNNACEVVAHLATKDLSDSHFISTQVSGELPSITDVIPAAQWYERECTEMFGIKFIGGSAKPLLRHENLGRPPLRKSTVLAARVLTPWPGGAEPEIKEDGRKVGNASRRRQRPPGVPENWLKQ
jgi:NADH-quinone oxidoreductase subunit C